MAGHADAGDYGSDPENVPVRQRARPDFAPTGLSYQGLMFYPKVLAGAEFDSNVLASPQNPADDIALVLSPELRIERLGENSQHVLDLGAKHYEYQEFDSENRTEAHARLKSFRHFGSDIKLDTLLEASRKFQLRGDSLTPTQAGKPIGYSDLRAETTVTKTFNRLGVAVGGGARHLSYDDGETAAGTEFDQSYRDGTIFTASLKPFYEISPGYRAYTRLEVNRRNYEGTGDLDRDSQGFTARAGLDFTLSALLFGFIEGGWLQQTYNNSLIPDAQGLSTKGQLNWLVTPLMTVSLIASRDVAEMAAPDQEARVDFTVGMQVDYELRRNLIVSFEAGYKNEDFSGSPRKDNVLKLGTEFDYLMNEYLSLGLRYSYFERNSNIDQFSFDRHVVMLNVTAQY